jgi:hypothetical protein
MDRAGSSVRGSSAVWRCNATSDARCAPARAGQGVVVKGVVVKGVVVKGVAVEVVAAVAVGTASRQQAPA